MCGIVGLIDLTGQYNFTNLSMQTMLRAITHRGPDDQGVVVNGNAALGSVRLSILDLSPQGHMPMNTPDGRYSIVYNGEVYNFSHLRQCLQKDGEAFHSETDTEVVLKWIVKHGLKGLSAFNGMFAFALHDSLEKKTTLVRDRLGVKPLFYSIQNGQVIFGSEIKTLLEAGVPKEIDMECFGESFALRYVSGERTLYKNIKRLLPGHYMTVQQGNITISRWWHLQDYTQQSSTRTPAEAVEWYRTTFDSAVQYRRISDVPVGVLLSGGLDSSSVAASLAEGNSRQLSSFTVRFSEKEYDEGILAKKVADKYKLDHNELFIKPADLFDFTLQLYKVHDEPVVHASDLFLYQISLLAKKKVTVLLSGEGGDETLGGYVRYKIFHRIALLRSALTLRHTLTRVPLGSKRYQKFLRMLSLGSVDELIHFNACDIFRSDCRSIGLRPGISSAYRETVLKEAKEAYPNEPLRQVMYYDMHIYLCSLLDRNDMMTMGASIECRVPFLDYRLVEGLASMPTPFIFRNAMPKGLLREALGHRLPQELLTARKQGFGVPWASYYRTQPLYTNYIKRLHNHPLISECFSNRNEIKNNSDKFLSGDGSRYAMTHQLLNMALWYDTHFM